MRRFFLASAILMVLVIVGVIVYLYNEHSIGIVATRWEVKLGLETVYFPKSPEPKDISVVVKERLPGVYISKIVTVASSEANIILLYQRVAGGGLPLWEDLCICTRAERAPLAIIRVEGGILKYTAGMISDETGKDLYNKFKASYNKYFADFPELNTEDSS